MEKTDNELIAEFMGLELVVPKLTVYKPYYRDRNPDGTLNRDYQFDKLLYDKSWDRLMPVVEKIHLLRDVKQVSISPGKTRIWFADHLAIGYIESPCKPENSSITECYLAVVAFIKWYNENKQP